MWRLDPEAGAGGDSVSLQPCTRNRPALADRRDPGQDPLQIQLASARALHESDLREGFGQVYLPFALARKYSNAGREWGWQAERFRNCSATRT